MRRQIAIKYSGRLHISIQTHQTSGYVLKALMYQEYTPGEGLDDRRAYTTGRPQSIYQSMKENPWEPKQLRANHIAVLQTEGEVRV